MGPCGTEFREAFSCFHYSQEEPKGKDCLDKFADMQECMKQYPELYEEKKTDKEEEKEEDKEEEKAEDKEKGEEPKVKEDGVEVKDIEITVVTKADTKDEEDTKPETETISDKAEELKL